MLQDNYQEQIVQNYDCQHLSLSCLFYNYTFHSLLGNVFTTNAYYAKLHNAWNVHHSNKIILYMTMSSPCTGVSHYEPSYGE